MLQQMATVAFQSMREARQKSYGAKQVSKPVLMDSCIAWASDGEWVKVRFPAYYSGTDALPEGAVSQSSFEQRLRDEGYSEPEIRRAPPNGFNDTHTHDFDVLALVLSGEVTIDCSGSATTYRPGDLVSLAANTPHTERFGPKGYKFMIGRRPAVPVRAAQASSALPGR
jgi:mannose-6-phosphate isomerase-like protein (cupin superfamily)